MTDRRPIEPEIRGTGEEDEPGSGDLVSREEAREAFSHRASGVALVAVRDEGSLHVTTVTSFMPISLEPPLLLVSLGGNAQVLPFLDPATRFVVNVLGPEHRKLASDYADSFPVGPSPFPEEGDPLLPGAPVSMVCRARSLTRVGEGILVVGAVEAMASSGTERALVYYRRGYRTLDPPE